MSSRTLERQSRKFQNGACLKSTAFYPVLGPALRGTTSTMPALGNAVPTTWKSTGLAGATITKLNNLWTAINTLRSQMVALNLHYHPAELSSAITTNANTNAVYDIANMLTYLRPGGDLLERKSIQLAKGVRLKNPANVEVCGGTPLATSEGGEPLTTANTVYVAVDFTGLTGDTNTDAYLTAMSTLTHECLSALADNHLLQTA